MNEFILDTDSFTLVQRQQPRMLASVATHRTAGHPVGLTVVTVEEQCLGWFNQFRTARDPAGLADASRMFAEAVPLWGTFVTHPQTVSSLAIFDRLVALKLNVGRNDLRIASVALDIGATVVTMNRRDFGRVPGLAVVDWSV